MIDLKNIFTWPVRLASRLAIAGPIFTKELRVASRRGRSYILRGAYLGLLMVVVVLVWLGAVGDMDESRAYSISRMSEAGKWIITSIVWFQFIGSQLVAVILMSTSISGEVHHRTLGILMTTPVGSLQIVAGKLFSKLWQIVLLLAVSLPLMAIVRVFGGVPWGFLLAGLGISLTAALFAGAVAMFYSAIFRRAYASILLSLGTGFVLYMVLGWMIGMVVAMLAVAKLNVVALLLYVNPYWALGVCTGELFSPGSGGFIGTGFYWPIHCLVMLGFSTGMLLLTALLVRKVAMRRAFGQAGLRAGAGLPPAVARPAPAALAQARPAATGDPAQPVVLEPATPAHPSPPAAPPPAPVPAQLAQARWAAQAAAPRAHAQTHGKVREIGGSPMLWRELRTPLFRSLAAKIAFPLVGGLILLMTYLVCGVADILDAGETHAVYAFLFVAMGATATAVLAATGITSEKEARTLPLLLTTALDDWHILRAKATGVFRRCLPVWAVLFGHVLLFAVPGFIHPVAMAHLAMVAAWVFVFLTASGLYFGSRFRRTTSAVIANFALALTLWVVVPVLLALMTAAARDAPAAEVLETLTQDSLSVNPAIQAWVVTAGAAGSDTMARGVAGFQYDWPEDDFPWRGTVIGTTLRLLAAMIGYGAAGLLFALRARRNLRRRAF